MDFSKLLAQATELGGGAWNQITSTVGAGVGYAQAAVGNLWVFGSTESSESYGDEKVDEKHYLLIPDRRSAEGYSLYVVRCLPEGVPPINDLPKRRLFHLPNEHALPTVEALLLDQAREKASADGPTKGSIGTRLNDLADQIDQLDGRIFGGVLLIGGLVALINPVAGAAIAVKALLPSIGLIFSKFGLRYVGDTAESKDVESQVRSAEKKVLKQFKESGTSSLVNPMLSQLDKALDTTEFEYDPLLEFDREALDFPEADRERYFKLTCQAISNAYEEVLEKPNLWGNCQLGPEDVRFLKLLKQLAAKK
ncbi:MAG: hypothetical protein AAF483_20735 [Planctomycetota bacterium]